MQGSRTISSLTSISIMAVALSTCGCSEGPQAVQLQSRSLVLLPAPPPVCPRCGASAWDFRTKASSNEVIAIGHATPPMHFTVPGQGVLACKVLSKAGTEYLLVGTIDANEAFSLYRYGLTASDGSPDLASETLLFDTGLEPAYVTSIWLTDDGTCFMLDRRCGDVLVATDTDADGWPDDLRATPFARADDYEHLVHARTIVGTDDATVAASRTSQFWLPALVRIYRDTNSDFVADEENAYEPGVLPRVRGALHDGQSEVVVRAPAGKTVEVWASDVDGDLLALLGSRAFLVEEEGTISVSPSLSEGDYVVVRYSGSPHLPVRSKVIDQRPRLVSAEPWYVELSGGPVTLTGHGFTQDMDVLLTTANETMHTLAFQYVDETEVTVTIPQLVSEDLGQAMLRVGDPTDPERGSVLLISVMDGGT